MNWFLRSCLFLSISGLICCQPENIEDGNFQSTDTIFGIVEFEFPISSQRVPIKAIQRLDLSLARTSYDLYRGNFLISANVSDLVPTYSFRLLAGEYYFRAGIICTCMGDTCLWDGFPGGRLGTKWMIDQIKIIKGQKIIQRIVFSK